MKGYRPDRAKVNQIFVFGSNLAGIHGKGAAQDAVHYWQARIGCGRGRTGNAYALPTKDVGLQPLPLSEIRKSVRKFLHYAEAHPELEFLVTAVGCGLAGYTIWKIAPLFQEAPKNCVLPEEFTQTYDTGTRS